MKLWSIDRAYCASLPSNVSAGLGWCVVFPLWCTSGSMPYADLYGGVRSRSTLAEFVSRAMPEMITPSK